MTRAFALFFNCIYVFIIVVIDRVVMLKFAELMDNSCDRRRIRVAQ